MFVEEFQCHIDSNVLQENFLIFFHYVVIANLEKIHLLKSKKISSLNSNELSDYKINLQLTLSHQNMSNIENDVKVLLQLFKYNETDKNSIANSKNIFEIDEKSLDYLISKFKEISNKIKL